VVSYEQLLEMALMSHDPFRAPFKTQYASLVLTSGDAQAATARTVATRLETARGRSIATRIEPLGEFYNAEDYHQKYYLRSDRTLMTDFRAMFADNAAFRESTAAARVNGYVAGDGSKLRLDAEIDLLGLTDAGRDRLRSKVRDGHFGAGCSIG
jgi:peptide-methionine (S)-S-oxide reductase